MIYMGSKNRLAKHIAPIIQSYVTPFTKGYLEPFVGGANMIDKIQCHKKIGCDIHPKLIALLTYIQDETNKLPCGVTAEEYKIVSKNRDAYPDWYVGLVGFCASFGPRYFEGYARSSPRQNYIAERIVALERQRPALKSIHFKACDYLSIPSLNNYVIYCDPPYKNTKKYTGAFDTNIFWEWVRKYSENNTVLVSEYQAPDDFTSIFSKTINSTVGLVSTKMPEKLFLLKGSRIE